jgi:hypothetical protein
MAGGIDWFRWHHGSVTDPKFQLVARKSGAGLPAVIAIWAYVLEKASEATERGHFGALDAEAVDCMFALADGTTARVLSEMDVRGLTLAGVVLSWDKRQPKREREDDKSTERVRAHREKQRLESMGNTLERHETPVERQETPRGEESRGEENSVTPNGVTCDEGSASIAPGGEPDACPHQAIIAAFHAAFPAARHVRDWTPARAATLRARWREKRNRQRIEWWEAFFAHCAKSKFLTGRSTPTPGRKPFELSLDWLIKSENFVKALEGGYHNVEDLEETP